MQNGKLKLVKGEGSIEDIQRSILRAIGETV